MILTAAMAGAFAAVDRETGSRVAAQIDHDLARDAAALTRALSTASAAPTAVEAAARRYLDDQPSFGSSARLYVIRVSGGSTITNEPELLGFATGNGVDRDAPEVQQTRAGTGTRNSLGAIRTPRPHADRRRSCPTIGRACRVPTPRDRDCRDRRAMGCRGPSRGECAARVSAGRRACAAGSDRGSPSRRTLDLAAGPGDRRTRPTGSTPVSWITASTPREPPTRSGAWPTGSTTCWTACSTPSITSASSWPTRPTSCEHR